RRLRGTRRVIHPAELIQRKRDGGELAAEELADLVRGYARGDVPDYQMAAFTMAVYFRGLSSAETFALTDAMIRSGATIDLGRALGRKVVDKHSTGGVGDKTSIAVGPIVAACGVPFGKMSGRGLGHTGGTLDKLESIPGFRVELSVDEFVEQVREIGLAIIGQSTNLVPADKRLYALRDVTATVDNISLIAASIMSKKIAAGADAIVLDVKVGDGAFMKALPDAQAPAQAIPELGRPAERAGRNRGRGRARRLRRRDRRHAGRARRPRARGRARLEGRADRPRRRRRLPAEAGRPRLGRRAARRGPRARRDGRRASGTGGGVGVRARRRASPRAADRARRRRVARWP